VSSTDLFLGRQPILDHGGNLVAFELLFRSSRADGADVRDDLIATATVINHAFSEIGVDAVLGHFTGYINLSTSLLMSDVIELLPRERVVLEVLESVEINDALLGRLRELRALGYRLALDDFVGDTGKYAPLLDLLDIVKVDVSGMDDATLADITIRLRRWPVRLLAEKVDTRAQVDRCRALGYELFQGYYFARPSLITGVRPSHAGSTILGLITLAAGKPDLAGIERVLRQSPELSVTLLRLVNARTSDRQHRIESLRDAAERLGAAELRRCVQLLIFAAPQAPGARFPTPLLVLAATRAKLMQLLACVTGDEREGDAAFLAGTLSLTGALLAESPAEVLAPLAVDADVRDAVLRRGGRLGALLTLAERIEQTDIAAIERLLVDLPGLDPARINDAWMGAIEWANTIAEA
jgi:c-di-GMP-related signal transduction protein